MNITEIDRLKGNYNQLESLRMPHGMYLASPSTDYHFVWLRDTFFEVLPYVDKDCGRYEKTYWRILDLFKEIEDKLTYHTEHKPVLWYEPIHAKYSAEDVKEVPDLEWGHMQNDAIGAILYGIGLGLRHGKEIIRDYHDAVIVDKLVKYLATLEYWQCEDHGIWEEYKEVRSSSIGACVAGLRILREHKYFRNSIHQGLIDSGMIALYELFSHETATRKHDLALLTLIYPYNIFRNEELYSWQIIRNVENNLLRDRGVIRYKGDSYYSTLEEEHGRGRSRDFYEGTEAEWCFGFGFLALSWMQIGNYNKAYGYIEKLESVMLPDCSIPELYYSNSNRYNGNCTLGWANAMYILAKEKYEKDINRK